MLKKITILALCAASAFAMHSGELNINESDVEVSAKFDVGQFNENVEPDTMFIGGKFLNAAEKHTSDENAKIDPYFEANFLLQKELASSGMTLGLGMKLNYTKDYSALPLGIEFSYKIPADALIPMYIHGNLYYAPSALAFSNAKDFLEYRIGYDVEVIPHGRVTVGYRTLKTNYDGGLGDFTYNESWYAGFIINF
jgi:hypothetical protein